MMRPYAVTAALCVCFYNTAELKAQDTQSSRLSAVIKAWRDTVESNEERVPHVRLVFRLDGTKPPWTDTGIDVLAGQQITLLAAGGVDIGWPRLFLPKQFLWVRVGTEGTVFNVSANTFTFEVKRPGRLYLSIKTWENLWADRFGKLAEDEFVRAPGEFNVAVIPWEQDGEPSLRLRKLTSLLPDELLIREEIERLRTPITLPAGFAIRNGQGEQTRVFSTFDDGTRWGVKAESVDDGTIIKRAVDLPLTGSTRIKWDWRYDEIPARGPETEFAHHDYVSLAVEFDNGKDITWLWSSELEPGTNFQCPLPWWNDKETHIVLRSGREGLGEWFAEERMILADYERAVGGQAPERVVGVWFIATTLMGHRPLKAYFSNVVVTTPKAEVRVLEKDSAFAEPNVRYVKPVRQP